MSTPKANPVEKVGRDLLLRPPELVSSDSIFDAFLDYTSTRGLELYDAQEEAIFELLAEKHVVLATPTGSGKSLVATALLFKSLSTGQKGFYTCPIKALVNEKFFDLCRVFGAENVGLMTGDASVNRDAPIVCGTAEILANLALRSSASPAATVVMDEFHYYADKERGAAWQIPLITLPKTQFLLMSATLGEVSQITKKLESFSGREVAHISGMTRPVPLAFEYRETALHETVQELSRSGKAPIYLVNFTQRAAADQAQALTSIDLCDKGEKAQLRDLLAKERFPSPYGKEIAKFLRVGIGVHHAGLLPRYRRLVERLAQKGLLKVISGTDTLGVGVNVPIRTVLFSQLCKFDGEKDTILPVREFLQIAGRAGRRGFDDVGYVVAQAPAHVIENKRLAAKGKKFVRRQPPKKGYVHFDEGTFNRLCTGKPESLVSRFTVDHGILLALLQSQDDDPKANHGYRRLLSLIERSHEKPGRKRILKRLSAQAFRTLRAADLVQVTRNSSRRGSRPRISEALQKDFSLHHTLALYLIDALDLLDANDENFAVDVLSLVESILENPRALLRAQVDLAKGELIAALKAEGVEYEERMERLETVEHPKPNGAFIYETFNAFSEKHPWVGSDNISPKGIAREIVDRNLTFNEYVRHLGVARSEGVLLRYLSQVLQALGRSVPMRYHDEAIADLVATLDATIRIVDGSLIEEWQSFSGDGSQAETERVDSADKGTAEAKPLYERLASDSRMLTARVRSELHRLLVALASKDYVEALELILDEDEAGQAWTAERMASEMAAFYEEQGHLDTTPSARTPAQTHLVKASANGERWNVAQTLVGGAEDSDWAILASIDLAAAARAGLPDDAPLLTLNRIGIS